MSGNTDTRRAELEDLSDSDLARELSKVTKRHELLVRRRDSQELVKTLAQRRALGFAGSAITGGRLDVRIEKLFDAIRENKLKVPVDEVLQVFDGIAGRIISKRIWIVIIGTFTILPAIASLWLLANQNKSMIEQNQVEEDSDYRGNLLAAMGIINGTLPQTVTENGESKVIDLPMHAPRLREEAFQTLVSLQKKRWSEAEKSSNPPTRFVEFRGCNLSELSLGGSIGLLTDLEESDLSRLYLANANLRMTRFLRATLDHSVFRNAQADSMWIVSPGAESVDFSGMRAPGALFTADFSTGSPFELTNANFDGAVLTGAEFDQVLFTDCTFDGTDLSGTVFKQCTFTNCDFTRAVIGDAIDWSDTGLHKCTLTESQLKSVKLAPFVYTEPGDTPGTVRVMGDIDKYNAWHAERQAKLNALAEEELKELKEKEERIKEVTQ